MSVQWALIGGRGMPGDQWFLGDRSLANDPDSPLAGSDVGVLQAVLIGLGYGLIDDGVYGPETAEQVRQFQQHRRLGVDGVFGPLTFRELTRVQEVANGARPFYLRDLPS